MIALHAWTSLMAGEVEGLKNDQALSSWMESKLRFRTSNIQRVRQLLKDPRLELPRVPLLSHAVG
jgi:hypothetical protein